MTSGPLLIRVTRTQLLPAIWILAGSLYPNPKSIARAEPGKAERPDFTPRRQDCLAFERRVDRAVVGRSTVQYSGVCLDSRNCNLPLVPYARETAKGLANEDIDPKYRKRYQRWKAELLRTKFGRVLWSKYWNNQQFRLSISIAPNPGGQHGASIAGYHWNANGDLNAATIVLGPKLDSDYPTDDHQYPILASLRPEIGEVTLLPETVAAAKFAHEFGHIEVVAASSQRLYCLQQFLAPIWNRVFFASGRVSQPEIERLMGGTPSEVSTQYEIDAEISGSLRFLNDRFPGKPGAHMPGRIRRAIKSFVTAQ